MRRRLTRFPATSRDSSASVPLDPGPSRWQLPDPATAPEGAEAIAAGADLAPETMLAGYRRGLFAMPEGRRLIWWSPDPRGVLRPADFHASRSLSRSSRRFEASVDQAFGDVVAACGDPRRGGGRWITDRYARAYAELHGLGWAHSIEVWLDGRLAGGVFGVEVGGLFCAESMFHHQTDASKAALWALTDRLGAAGGDRLIDVQWLTDHLATLGAREVPRAAYLALLPRLTRLPATLRAEAPAHFRQFLARGGDAA